MNIEHQKRSWILQRWSTKTNLSYFLVNRFLKEYTYKELCRPFILEDRGKSSEQRLAIKYKMTRQEIRTILGKCKEVAKVQENGE